jgi:hypothetical protein
MAMQIFRGHLFFKTATFEKSGRDDGHLATLSRKNSRKIHIVSAAQT